MARYYSNIYIFGTSTKPNCLWIDANGDQPQTGFQVHFPEFITDPSSPELPAGKDINYFCNRGPPFQLRTDPDPKDVTYWLLDGQTKRSIDSPHGLNGRDHPRRFGQKSQRRQQPYIDPHLNKLIVSNDTEQCTTKLCTSETSRGPDFANIADDTFCRMSDKSLWPICSPTGAEDNCFSLDLQQLIIGGKMARDSPYDQVVDWTLEA